MKKLILCNIPKEYCNARTTEGHCSLGSGYECQPVIEKCRENKGCEKIENGYCSVYIFPEAKWRSGNCPAATHLEIEELTAKQKAKMRVGQQKHTKF